MKRILSLFLCIALSMTMIIVPGVTAMAEDVPNYEDHIPGEMPANLITTGGPYDKQYFTANGTTKAKVSYNNYATEHFSVNPVLEYDGTTTVGKEATYCLPGAWIYTSILPASAILQDETYVVKFQARNNQEHNAKVNFAALNYKNYSTLDYTKEYGLEGLELTGSDWHEFKGTVHIKPETVSNVTARFNIGLSTTSLAGTGVDILNGHSAGVDKVYLAYEEPYDITNNLTSASSTIQVGESASFEAEVLNQLELPGYLDQTFVWKAMDTERENEISGINIVTSDDTKTATVTIGDTVLPGSYDIVAYSETYNMAKGYTITLEAPYYYTDSGSLVTQAKLNVDDVWTSDRVSTGLVNFIEVKATLENNTEAFEWLITDENRVNIVDDVFTVTPVTTSGAEQIVNVAAMAGVDVKPGNYNVVAVAQDGSLKAQPISLDITGDLSVILNTFTNGTVQDIEDGLNTSYLSVLGLLNSNSSKADKTAFAKVIFGAAEEEGIGGITEVEDIKEVLERLAVVSFYNVKPQDVELVDQNACFVFEEELGIDEIDTNGVDLYALYKTAMTEVGQANVLADVTGKEFVTASELVSKLKTSIVLNAIAHPVANGNEYVGTILTDANMASAGIAIGNYSTSNQKSSYNLAIAGRTLTIAELEAELAKTYTDASTSTGGNTGSNIGSGSISSGSGSGSSSSGGGGSSGGFGGSISVPAKPNSNNDESTNNSNDVNYGDVNSAHWAFPEIVFLSKIGVISGADDGNFYPEKTVSREEILKMLCVAFKLNITENDCDFSDVDKSAWYYKYVASANAGGIVNGIGDLKFGIGTAVTRQDICVMIMRIMNTGDEIYPDASFEDVGDVAEYAKNAVNYLSAFYVINGFSDNTFRPNAYCTKAEAAKIISNALHILDGITE